MTEIPINCLILKLSYSIVRNPVYRNSNFSINVNNNTWNNDTNMLSNTYQLCAIIGNVVLFFSCPLYSKFLTLSFKCFLSVHTPVTSTWPHLNSDVGLEEGEY